MKQVRVRGVQLIVGIPSYLEADTIGFVTRQVDLGIQRYFRNMVSVIINMDNNSDDDTRGAFLGVETATPKLYFTTPEGVRGKGNNMMNLFRYVRAHMASVKAVVVLDADLRSVTPEWIKHFVDPILKGYDYVLPRYSRHQFDGTITNHICYPLLYGLLGQNVRQPIGGDFAFSPRLARYWLDQKWLSTTRQYGIDIFMTLNAVMGGFRICEVGLGAKVHKASAPKLGPMFTQVVTTFFDQILSKKSDWIGIPGEQLKQKPLFGIRKLDPPQELSIDIRDLKDKLRQEFVTREKLLKKYLSPYLYLNIRHMIDRDHYDMDTLMWTQSVYQILFTFDTGTQKMKRDIIEALKPLYFARSVTFDYETWRYRIDYAEELILHQAMAFASQKPYFYGLYLKRAQEADMKKKLPSRKS
ncbi:MAG: glycosyltransferase [Spirochaetes bacterium]|nr:glycosyltransferase [Spirochaetota bacterium]